MTLLARLLAFLSRWWEGIPRPAPPPAPAAAPAAKEVAPPAPPSAADFVAGFEGFRAAAYRCPAGVWTLGYGSTRLASGARVQQGDAITEPEARLLLARDLASAGDAVRRLVTVPLTAGQRVALTSFAYNCGEAALASSTLLKLLNSGDRQGAADQFGRWVKGGGETLPGLVKRRAAERALFLA